MSRTIEVSIFGNTYTLQSSGDDERIIEIANFVDQKMSEIAKNTAINSPTNVAILVALNLANELKDIAESQVESDTELQNIDNLITKVKQAYVQV